MYDELLVTINLKIKLTRMKENGQVF